MGKRTRETENEPEPGWGEPDFIWNRRRSLNLGKPMTKSASQGYWGLEIGGGALLLGMAFATVAGHESGHDGANSPA